MFIITGIVESLLLLNALTEPYQIWQVVLTTKRLEHDRGGGGAPPYLLRGGSGYRRPHPHMVGNARHMECFKQPLGVWDVTPTPDPHSP